MQACLHEEVVYDALPGAVFRQRDVEPLHQASPRRLVQLLAAGGPRYRNSFFFCIFFGGLQYVGHSFAYVAHL
jgi:hypothetical protein